MKKEARYYRKTGNNTVQCQLCPHNCRIGEGNHGICGVRENEGGTLYSTIYGEVTAVAMDPIEKKPLYHFHPGSGILSIGTKGCNFKCPYCQNWNISQDLRAHTSRYTPEQIVNLAKDNGSDGIAYTYSEPMIWCEYVMDCAELARSRGLYNVMVTNGFVNMEPLDDLLTCIDAMNIDLKSFREDSYRREQKGALSPVLKTIERAAGACHVELTTLIVTGLNDTFEEMQDIIDWIAALDRGIPWHISRYYPGYKYDSPATDIDFMLEVYDRAVKKLDYVFCGNIAGSYGRSDTLCPVCRSVVISRTGYRVRTGTLKEGACAECGTALKIVQ
ncbi:MAG TPA: AmmeMemoRadiSam system radical SAM enzyme [Spirochaetota bacterium]|nr:AmmeMemoRadiSam system radical SAM enzyme [Spirochaetota bacterium]